MPLYRLTAGAHEERFLAHTDAAALLYAAKVAAKHQLPAEVFEGCPAAIGRKSTERPIGTASPTTR